MTDVSARVRNRLQDGLIDWQERRYRQADFRQQQADIHRSRMTCSASLPVFHQTQDWTGSVGISPSGRFQVIEESKPKKRIISREGLRWNAAITLLVVLGLLFAVILVADLAGIGRSGRVIGKLNTKIETLENRNSEISSEIEMAADSASVCTEAVKLNLISSNGAKTVRLTAPANAQLTLSSADKAAENADLEGRLTSLAGD